MKKRSVENHLWWSIQWAIALFFIMPGCTECSGRKHSSGATAPPPVVHPSSVGSKPVSGMYGSGAFQPRVGGAPAPPPPPIYTGIYPIPPAFGYLGRGIYPVNYGPPRMTFGSRRVPPPPIPPPVYRSGARGGGSLLHHRVQIPLTDDLDDDDDDLDGGGGGGGGDDDDDRHHQLGGGGGGGAHPCADMCRDTYFSCLGSCMCIPPSWRCDGVGDCAGEEDELDCDGDADVDVDVDTCLPADNKVRCPRTGRCIKEDWLCDGQDDCGDFSDETHCGYEVNCTLLQHSCDNGFCVPLAWRCDGDNDCMDYSDEANCSRSLACSDQEFRCSDGNCIAVTWKCDLEPDCSDASDERDCAEVPVPVCQEDEFHCANPRCVRLEFRCDGDDDCGDRSDEQDCPQPHNNCTDDEFRCHGGQCIPRHWRCDAERDCKAGEDEEECGARAGHTCPADEYTCSAGNCILRSWVCDGMLDCPEGEDEASCEASCEDAHFQCNVTGLVCIGRKHVCDGNKDCPRGDDEERCPQKQQCLPTSRCEHVCVLHADGTDGCTCFMGYTLGPDGYSCLDVDECGFETEPVCAQTCRNTAGSFQCGCVTGYVLRPDARSCKALGGAPTLLFANRIDIRQISLNGAKYVPLLKGLQNAIAIDYHYKRGWLFWSDTVMDVIRRASLNGSGSVDVVRWGLETPTGVAVDWVHDLLFWTDSGTQRVEVATLQGEHRFTLAARDLDKPRAIVVHPGEALVWWTDWGPSPKIERAHMDGGGRHPIVKDALLWPNGLALDYAGARLYWSDAKRHVIESSRLDGSDRRKVLSKGLPHPFALTLFEDALYWTDWHSKSILTADKASGMGLRTVHGTLHFPMDIHSYHPLRQPAYNNRCGDNNGGCSHMCLPSNSSYVCVCPMGTRLKADGRTCDDRPEPLLVFARKKELRVRLLGGDAADAPAAPAAVEMVVPVDGVRSVVALEWDGEGGGVLWSDVQADAISWSGLDGSGERVVVSTNLESPCGLAVDWVTRKLYWTDAGTNRVEVANMDGSMRSLLVWEALDKPRDIVVDPLGRYMYWTDWGSTPKIERAGMDGSGRVSLHTHHLAYPNGLAVDSRRGRLYWVDGGRKTIEWSGLDGMERTVLLDGLDHPFSLALFNDTIYWTDWLKASIYRADQDTGLNRRVVRSGVSGIMEVRVFHQARENIPSECHKDNGGCSHLCLLAPAPDRYTCACPIGVQLQADGRTCARGPTNSLIIAHRVDIRQISLDVPYVVDVVLPLPPLKNAIAVDVDRKTGEIYWTDTAEDVIQKATPDGKHMETVIFDGLVTADGIVVDSTGRKVYWTDAGRSSIEVSELSGAHRKVLVWTLLESPRAITLHYHLGLMYWTDWGRHAKIEQAHMDGRNRRTLIGEGLGWPNGLAIDRPAARLYWNDSKKKTIESSDLGGGDRRVVVSGVGHPFGLVIVGDHMYWSDWDTEAVHRAGKLNGSDSTPIRGGLEGLMDIRSVQVDNLAENACGDDNGGCSHLCLRTPSGYSCACPTGVVLRADGRTCHTPPSTFLLFATRNTLARMSLDTPELWDVTLQIPGVHNAIAVDFHWRKLKIYYTDVHLDIIRSVDMHNLSRTEELVSTNLTTPDGLAVDWLADNMYWTDAGRKVLEVARVDGSCRRRLVGVGLDEPRALALYPSKGYLYWTDWGDNPKIERAYMDGSSRTTVVGADLGFPNGLTVDYEGCALYWADALRDRIETSDLAGNYRRQLLAEATHPFGLTQLGEHVFWTDWYKKSVERADKRTGSQRAVLRRDLDGVMEIRAVAAHRQRGWTPCVVGNGGCSHLCLHTPLGHVCACPDLEDGRPCSSEAATTEPLVNPDPEEDSHDCLFDVLPETVTLPREDGEEVRVDDDGRKDGERPLQRATPSAAPAPIPSAAPEDKGQAESHVLTLTMVLLSLLAFLLLLLLLLLLFRRRGAHKQYLYATGRSVLTFSNPNYTAHDGGGPPPPQDRRSFLWRRLKYDRGQERVYNLQEDKQGAAPEGVSLILAVMTPAPGPASAPPSHPDGGPATPSRTPERMSTPPSPPSPPRRPDLSLQVC